MKTPPIWGYIVGISMMFFGGCGVLNDIKLINTPMLFDVQKKMWEDISNMEKKSDSTSLAYSDSMLSKIHKNNHLQTLGDMAKSMEEVYGMSDFTRTWIVRFGYIGLFVAIIYILGGVFLLLKRNFSIKLAYGSIALSILFSIVRWWVLAIDSGPGQVIGLAAGTSQIFGLVIDFILLVVIFASDKTAYYQNSTIE